MPLSTAERGSLGGQVAAANMTAAQRRERARRAHLAGAVKAVVARAPELSPEQVATLREVFGGASR